MEQNIFKRNLLIPFLKIVIDTLAIGGAFLFSYYTRFHSPLVNLFPVTKGYPPFINYLIASIFLTGAYLFLFSTFHSYHSRYFSTFSQDIPVILRTCFWGILLAMSMAFLYRGFSYSRLTFILMFIYTNLLVLIGRYFFYLLRTNLLIRGYSIQRIILGGSAGVIPKILPQIQRERNQFITITGYCSEDEIPGVAYPYLGSFARISTILEEARPDGLLLVMQSKDHDEILHIMEKTEGKNIDLYFIPDIIDLMALHTSTLEIGGMPVFRLKSAAFSGWQGLIKRSFDFIVSLMAVVLLSPLFLALAVLVKLSSRGPVFYRQPRVGLDGKEFNIFKFRSMVTNAEQKTGPVWATQNDSRVTWLGRLLRRSSLDELPQLFNVIKGEMSLVGPRPERLVFVEKFRGSIPKYSERHRVRSGVTGWAQVNGLRGQSPIEERTRYDVYYIENWSLWFDIKIILLTFLAIIRGENAY